MRDQVADDLRRAGMRVPTDDHQTAVVELAARTEIDEIAAQGAVGKVVEDVAVEFCWRSEGIRPRDGTDLCIVGGAGRLCEDVASHGAVVVHRESAFAYVRDGDSAARRDGAEVVDDVFGAILELDASTEILDAGAVVLVAPGAAGHDAAGADRDLDVVSREEAVEACAGALRPDPGRAASLRIQVAGEHDRHGAALAGLGRDLYWYSTARALRHDAVRSIPPGRDVTVDRDADRTRLAARVSAAHEGAAEDIDQVRGTGRVDRGVARDSSATTDALRQDSRRAFTTRHRAAGLNRTVEVDSHGAAVAAAAATERNGYSDPDADLAAPVAIWDKTATGNSLQAADPPNPPPPPTLCAKMP